MADPVLTHTCSLFLCYGDRQTGELAAVDRLCALGHPHWVAFADVGARHLCSFDEALSTPSAEDFLSARVQAQ